MASSLGEPLDALILRCVRYGDSDLIVHLLTLQEGQISAMAKGARSAKSRLGMRLEPMSRVRATLRTGRGDLRIVATVDPMGHWHGLRGSYPLQQVAAAALDFVSRVTVQGEPAEAVFHLTDRFLTLLNGQAGVSDERVSSDVPAALLAAFQLKLLFALGVAPELGVCVRCGRTDQLVAFSPQDGGVVCLDDRTASDRPLDPAVAIAAMAALSEPLGSVLEMTAQEQTALARSSVVVSAPMALQHAGVRLR